MTFAAHALIKACLLISFTFFGSAYSKAESKQCERVMPANRRAELLTKFVQANQLFPQSLGKWALPSILLGEFLSDPFDIRDFAMKLSPDEIADLSARLGLSPQATRSLWINTILKSSNRLIEMVHSFAPDNNFNFARLQRQLYGTKSNQEKLNTSRAALVKLQKQWHSDLYSDLFKQIGLAIANGFKTSNVKGMAVIYRDFLKSSENSKAQLLDSAIIETVLLEIDSEFIQYSDFFRRRLGELLSHGK